MRRLLYYLLTTCSIHLTAQDWVIDSISYFNSNYYAIYSEDYKKGLSATNRAVRLSTLAGDAELEAEAQKNYGIVLYLTGNYEKALNAYLRSLYLFDSLDNKRGIARISNEIGNYYRKLGFPNKAIEAWSEAERISRKLNDLETLGTSLGMQATFHWERGEFDRSDPLYLEGYNIRIQQNDSIGLGYILLALSDIEMRNDNPSKALGFIRQSIKIRLKINDQQGLLESYKALADHYTKRLIPDSALMYYHQTAIRSNEFEYRDLARESYDSLSSILHAKGEFEKAFEYKVIAENLEDTLFNIARNRQIAEIQTKYETEKKEQQIALQRAEISEQEAQLIQNRILLIACAITLFLLVIIGILWRTRLNKKQLLLLQEERLHSKEAEINAAISSQERERARYARDLHDGFGQMISILNLNIENLKNDSKTEEHEKVFEESEKVINEMYDELKGICFDLMPQTLIKNGLQSGLEDFAHRINKSERVFVETNFFGLECRLNEVQEISLYRISQEWINNVLKHSDADKIMLQITRDHQEITLLIEDNGSGFEKSLLRESKGNGWKNLHTRTSLIQGSLEVETAVGKKGNVLIVNAPSKRSSPTLTLENTILAR